MKSFIISLFLAISGIVFSQQAIIKPPTPTPIQEDPNCCAYFWTVTLDKTQINNLHTTPIIALVPPIGKGIRLVKTVVMETHFDGVQWIFASGEFVNIYNDAGVLPIMSQFSDPCITEEGVYSGSFWHNYECVRSGQVINGATVWGQVKIKSTFPISGGGTNSQMVFKFYYELVDY